jgi:hypothetical protein
MTVKLLVPDEELLLSTSPNSNEVTRTTMQDFDNWSNWEVCLTRWKDKEQFGNLNILPLVNYNLELFPDELAFCKQQQTMAINPLIVELKYQVWVALDEMISLLGQVSDGSIQVLVLSHQLLGQLPMKMLLGLDDWTQGFQLDSCASQL